MLSFNWRLLLHIHNMYIYIYLCVCIYIYTVCIHKYMYTFTSITYVQDTMTGELSTKRKNTSPAPPLVFSAQVSPIQSSTCPTFTQPKCSSATYSLSLNNTGNENRGEDEGRQRPTACTVLVAATRKQLPGREEKKKQATQALGFRAGCGGGAELPSLRLP